MNAEWQSHSHSFNTRRGYLLQIKDELGNIGYGDCAPIPSHGTESTAEALNTFESQLPNLFGASATAALQKLPDIHSSPAAHCAIETALLDLVTRQQATPLHKWLNPRSGSKIRINANVGALDESCFERIATAIKQGISVLKIKVGVTEAQNELERLKQIYNVMPSNIQLRLDANRAWDFSTAKNFIASISQMPIESLEEPLAKPNISALKQLQNETNITLALDETLAEIDTDQLHQIYPLQRIILKPMVLGGVLPALRLGQGAHDLGIETVVTTTVDSAAGVWAASQLAAALDSEGKLCHGLATSGWLQQDLGTAPNIENGSITIPQTPGLGFCPLD
jgi:o-succinylbenzoate synthase